MQKTYEILVSGSLNWGPIAAVVVAGVITGMLIAWLCWTRGNARKNL